MSCVDSKKDQDCEPGPFCAAGGLVAAPDLEALVVKWLGHFDDLTAANEPNSSIYWECASDLLQVIKCNET